MSLLWKRKADFWVKIAAGQARAGAGAAAGAARRNLSRNVRRGVRRSGSAGNIGRSGVPYLWTKNVGLWTEIAFMDKKCIYRQCLHLWTRKVDLWTRNALYGRKVLFYGKKYLSFYILN